MSRTKFVAHDVQNVPLPMQFVHFGSQSKQLAPD